MAIKITIASVLFLLAGACYLLRELKIAKKKAIVDLMKDFVDSSPAVIILPFCNFQSALFLMSCLIANEFIYDNIFAGAGLFAIGYVSASVISVWGDFVAAKAIVSIGASAAAIIPLLAFWKGEAKMKAAAGVYGALTIPVLSYAFSITWNPGFLALAVGDALLIVAETMPENKAARVISDMFYFFGTCFVPLSLTGGWL